jgi:hypothetical protein
LFKKEKLVSIFRIFHLFSLLAFVRFGALGFVIFPVHALTLGGAVLCFFASRADQQFSRNSLTDWALISNPVFFVASADVSGATFFGTQHDGDQNRHLLSFSTFRVTEKGKSNPNR